ncbi:DUF1631 family protein [Rhodanobacter caeni]|uniref:DUF1631 family protein n=1 Tax=Rhodanobacter caeni TaxID=657654 RepID=UPI0031DC1C80
MDAEQQQRASLVSGSAPDTRRGHWPARAQRLLEEICAHCVAELHQPLQRSLAAFDQHIFTRAEKSHQASEQQEYFATRQRVQQDRASLGQRFANHLVVGFDRIGHHPPAPAKQPNTWGQLELLDPVEHELSMTLEQLSARAEARHGTVLHELAYRLGVLVAAPPLEGEALPNGPRALIHAFHHVSASLALPLQQQQTLLHCFDQSVLRTLAPLLAAVNTRLLGDGILPRLRGTQLPRHAISRPHAVPTPGATPAAARSAPASHEPIAVLESLRDLLARQRGIDGTTGQPAGRAASPEELETALAALQQHLVAVTDHASRELRSAQRLRDELLFHLNSGKPADAPRTELSGEQGDTVELVAMLFEQLGEQLQRSGDARALLGGLQLPLLRMAMADHDFFERPEHPARQLLDTVTTTANDWFEGSDEESNRPLTAKLEQLVSRARQEPPSADLYASLLADIKRHVELLSRKAQAAEHRHLEAAQGRERLDRARQRATELMAERFAQSPPRGLLRALLDRAWSDVLALTLLRHGEDSEAFVAQLRVTDQLLDRAPTTDRQQLRQDVETGLQQIGMHAEEAEQVAQRLLGIEQVDPAVDLPSATDLALRLKQHQRLGEQSDHAEPAPPQPPVDPRERETLLRLRQMPFGSWFEFDDPATGQVARRKLSWYSPMSGRCLMVTRRGQRGAEMTLAQLAHEIASGRAREMPASRESLLDRAWHGLTGALRQSITPSAVAQGNRRS